MRRVQVWDDIRPGAVWSVSGRAWISRAIQWVCRSKWNHSGWVIEPGPDGELRTQEALTSLQVNPFSNYRDEFDAGNLAVYQPEVCPPALAHALLKALDRVGRPYGWASTASLLVFVPLNKFLGLFNRQLPTPFRAFEKCSEEVLVALLDMLEAEHKMGHDCPDLEWCPSVPDREGFTPADLVAYCEKACRLPHP